MVRGRNLLQLASEGWNCQNRQNQHRKFSAHNLGIGGNGFGREWLPGGMTIAERSGGQKAVLCLRS
jgi:hypothetical protein